jgi:archaellin
MDMKLLNKALKEVKEKLKLDYALNKGFMCPTCSTKMINETYGEQAIGIYVRWFGKDQEQPPIKQLNKLYINHDLGKENCDFRKTEIVKILSKYYDVVWDYSDEQSIQIIEKGESKNA